MKINASQSEFARLTGLSRQAINKAIAAGLLPFEIEKGKKVIDINNLDVKDYVDSQSRQREAAKKKDEIILSELPTKKQTKTKELSKSQLKNILKKRNPSELPSKKIESNVDYSETTINEIHKKIKIAELQKKQMQIEIMQKNFLPTEFIKDGLFRYLEKLNSTIERMSSVYIKEVGQRILAEGEVRPAHIEDFQIKILRSIDDTKENIIKEIDKHEPN